MRVWAVTVLVMLLQISGAHADALQSAMEALNTRLKYAGEGGGLVLNEGACHKPLDVNDNRQYVGSGTVVFINKSDQAVLIGTGSCNGGNGSGQYLIVIQNGQPDIIDNIGIRDMNFLADHMYADGNSIVLHGNRWMQNDPHCCPSRMATLQYNIKTQDHKLTLLPKQ